MDRLGLFDAIAIARLSSEISSLQGSNVPVTVAPATDDSAYDQPDEIRALYESLRTLDDRLAAVSLVRERVWHGPGQRRSVSRRNQHILDSHRTEWLYGPVDAVAWFQQRGRATALLTIASANDMAVGQPGGGYPTMSGPLDMGVTDHVFGPDVAGFAGLGLEAAIAHAEQQFGGRPAHTARTVAQQRLHQLRDFIAAPVSPLFHRVARYCTDSLGIRSRKAVVGQRMVEALQHRVSAPGPALILSFGCGTAYPILAEISAWVAAGNPAPTLVLVDQDPVALAVAMRLAQQMGLGTHVEIHCRRLFDQLGRPVALDQVLRGRRIDIAEDSGLREYLPDTIYRWLTRQSWRALKPDGLMISGNMNAARPQPEVLHGMMGWSPSVKMRTIRAGLDLHAAAGVPPQCTRVTITPEGVYSLFFSYKSAQ
jgi:hypothetical protein